MTFSAAASFDPSGGPVQAEWAFGDGDTATGTEVQHVYPAPGRYRATLTVTAASGRATQTTIPITVGGALPTLDLLSPMPAPVRAGTQVPLRAAASDPFEPDEDLAVRWEARLVHNGHVHPAVFTADGPAAALPALPHGTFEELSYYTVTATVTDTEGLVVSRSVALPLVPMDIATADLAGAGPVVEFERSVRVRSVCVPEPGLSAEAVGVEVRRDDAWTTPDFAQAVAAAAGTCVLFVEAEGDAVRVAPGAGPPTVQLRLGRPEALPDGLELIAVGGETTSASSAPLPDGVVLAKTGDAGEAVVYQAVGDDEGVEAAVTDRFGAGEAGVVLRDGFAGDGALAEAMRRPDGHLVLNTRLRGVARVDSLGRFPERTAVRLQRTPSGLSVDVGAPGEVWETVSVVRGWPSGPQLAGVVARSEGDFVAWFGGLRVGTDGAATEDPSPTGGLAIRTLSPNPSQGRIQVAVDAPEAGTYRLEVFDALGRMVYTDEQARSLPARVRFSLDLPRLPAGAYTLRVMHPASGAAGVAPFTRIR